MVVRNAKAPSRKYQFLQLPKSVYAADRQPATGDPVLRFFDDHQLRPHELVLWSDGSLRWRVSEQLASTADMCSHEKAGFAAFVISTTGAFYIFNHRDKIDCIAHSTFGGFAVRAAGEVQIIDGIILVLTNHTGHYRPSLIQTAAMLYWFDRRGLLNADTQLSLVRPPTGRELKLLGSSMVRHLAVKKHLEPQEIQVVARNKTAIIELQIRIGTLETQPVQVSNVDKGPEIRKKIEEIHATAPFEVSDSLLSQMTGYSQAEIQKAKEGLPVIATREELEASRAKEIQKLKYSVEDKLDLIRNIERDLILSDVYPAMVFSRTVIGLTRAFEQLDIL